MTWTEPTAHDPGITVLEVLSYSLAAFSVGALLSRRGRGAPCGWPCAGLLAASVVAAMARGREERAQSSGERGAVVGT
jgi:hypothetical protein